MSSSTATGRIGQPPQSRTSAQSVPPNQTLYISNINDKIHKTDLRLALYTLFSTYGIVLDVVALKTPKMRGQAHIAFRDIASASSAMRACQGIVFFGKEMKIQYAKSKSDAIAKLDGTYRMPSLRGGESTTATTSSFVPLPGQDKDKDKEPESSKPETAEMHGTKRRRDESEEEEEDQDVEMEVEEDDEE